MNRRTAPAMLALFAISAGLAVAKFARPSLMPAERLLARAHAHLKENPEDAKAHYVAGRIHYLAFYNRASRVAAYGSAESAELPSIAPYWSAEHRFLPDARRTEATIRALKKFGAETLSDLPQEKVREFYQEVSQVTADLTKAEWKPKQEVPGIAAEHATLALKAFDKAIDLDPENPLYLLGKASLLEQAKAFYSKEKPQRVDKILANTSAERIRDAYFRAYANGVKEALKLKNKPVAGLRSIASYEAGTAFVRLCENEKLESAEKKRLAEVNENLAKLDKLRRGAITPIIFSLRKGAALGDLLEPGKKVTFDLDGDGVAEPWPWVRGDTALLVWDPDRSGRILSGRQLFGSYTWQIPWENGYEPLAMLDQSSDGQLSGQELEGIRVWFDRDGNGVSDDGEVVDLGSLDILSIATSGSPAAAGAPLSNPHGVYLQGGSTLASWDWIPSR